MASEIKISFQQEAQFRAWSKDPVLFCREAIKIESVVVEEVDGKEVKRPGKIVPFEVRDYQEDCISRFLRSQICAVLKARQIGLTTTACALALWLLLFQENRFILVLSKNDTDAKKFMRRIKNMYKRLPAWVRARGPQLLRNRWGVQEAEFDNGSVIFSATSASDHGRGDTPTHVFLDEVGKMRNQEESWSSLVPAIDAGGNLWMFGTAEGFRDWFHLKWMEWEKDEETDTIFYGWDVVEDRDENWATKMRRKLGEALFRREYPSTAEEAFVTSGSNVFSIEVLNEVDVWPPRRYQLGRDVNGYLELIPEPNDTDEFGFFVFEPPTANARYVVSGDPSEGLVDGDPSVLQVLRWQGNLLTQVAVLRGLFDPDDFADMAHRIALFYNRATVVIERNNHGISVLKRLVVNHTPNIIRARDRKLGLWTSASSKAANIVTTRKALAEQTLILRDQRTIDELMGFQEILTANGNVQYKGSDHDDHVDALCLGVGYAVPNTPRDRPAEPPEQTQQAHPYSLEGLMGRRVSRKQHI